MSHILLDEWFTSFKDYIASRNNIPYLSKLKTNFMKEVKNEFTGGSVEITKRIKDRKHSFNELSSFLDFCDMGSLSDARKKFDKACEEYTTFVQVLNTFTSNEENNRQHDETGDTTNHSVQNQPTIRTVNKPVAIMNGDQAHVQGPSDQNKTASHHNINQVSSTPVETTISQNQVQSTPQPQRVTGEYYSQMYQNNNDDIYGGSNQYPEKERNSSIQGTQKMSVTKKCPQDPDPEYEMETANGKPKDLESTKHTQANVNTNARAEEGKWKKSSNIEDDSESADIYGRSEKASIILRYNNPNIADLSDPNRPTKLAERFSELYTNEYTDAFEELEKDHFREGATVYHLLRVVRRAYEHCQNWNLKIEEEIKKEKTKGTYSEHKMILDREKQQEDKKLLVKRQKDMVVQKFNEDIIPTILPETVPKIAKSKYLRYAEQCVEIIWLMCVQNPPIHLEWLQDRPMDQPATLRFDSELYRAYTKSGPYVDFCVWPLVRLHKDGPVLSKGIAQGINK